MPFILQNRHLHCIQFFPNLNVPSAQAVPNCASQYLEKPDFDIRSLDPLLSIKMTSRALHSLPRSEETRKTAFPDTNAKITQDSTYPGKCLLYLPGSSQSYRTSSGGLPTTSRPTLTSRRKHVNTFSQTLQHLRLSPICCNLGFSFFRLSPQTTEVKFASQIFCVMGPCLYKPLQYYGYLRICS